MLLKAAALGILLLLASPIVGGATELICPGGADHNSRLDITWCSDFDTLTNCTTGQETSCWTDNGYAASMGSGPYGYAIVSGGGAVGNGYVRGRPRPGSTGSGSAAVEPVPGFPSTAVNVRYYLRYRGGYISFEGGHNVQFEASGTPYCTSALKFQLSTYTGYTYYPLGCAESSFGFYASPATLLNNRWYLIEYQGVMDSIWTPRIDTTLALTVSASTQTVSRSSGSFVSDGWTANMHVMTTGLTGNNNGQWTVDSVSDLTMQLGGRNGGGQLSDETASGRLRSMELHDANGIIRVWIDETLVLEQTDLNMGGVTNAMQWGWRMLAPEMYYHYGVPPWGFEIDWDNIAVSNTGTYIGPAASENARGTGDPSSPYGNAIPYGAWLGRHAADDCTNSGAAGEYFTTQWRSGSSLDATRTHGSYVNACADTVSWRNIIYGASNTRTSGMLFTVTDGATSSDCTAGGGSYRHNCYWNGPVNGNPATAWQFTEAADNSLRVSLVNASDGGGGVKWRDDSYVFPQWASYGWVYLPSSNTYTVTNLALSGFVNSYTGSTDGYVALSVSGGNWSVDQMNTAGVHGSLVSSTPVAYDTWHEYELILWKNGVHGCASANGCASLMIDRGRVYDTQALPQSAAWAFQADVAMPSAVVGVIDFQGTPPFTAYFDDSVVTTVSAWSCDGWGAASCPFGGVRVSRGVQLGRGVAVR